MISEDARLPVCHVHRCPCVSYVSNPKLWEFSGEDKEDMKL